MIDHAQYIWNSKPLWQAKIKITNMTEDKQHKNRRKKKYFEIIMQKTLMSELVT